MTSEYPNNAPKLGHIPTLDDVNYTSTQSGSNGTASSGQDLKNSFAESAQSALNSVANHPVTQDVKNTVNNGPVGQSVKNQYANTASEFQNLKDSRTRPNEKTATGQQLTHYHSLFYNLLSWQNPRATSIAFILNVAAIFAIRYIPIIPYLCKVIYMTLGATAAAEIVGRLVFNSGFTSQLRPRKYYTLPKETVDQVLDDVHELLNFFVIESQRILFAENVSYTVAAFAAALADYLLIKIVPLWGLALISTCLLYFVPFVYVNNREAIDDGLNNASHILSKQTEQIKHVAEHHTARASETVKSMAGDYSAKAQEYMGSARQASANAANKASATASQAANRASEATSRAANKTSETTSQAANRASEVTSQAANTTSETASQAANKTSEATSNAANRASEVTSQAANQAYDTSSNIANQARDTSSNIANQARDTSSNIANNASAATSGSGYNSNAGYGNYSSAYQSSDFPNAPATGPTPHDRQFQNTGDELSQQAGVGHVKREEGPVYAS